MLTLENTTGHTQEELNIMNEEVDCLMSIWGFTPLRRIEIPTAYETNLVLAERMVIERREEEL